MTTTENSRHSLPSTARGLVEDLRETDGRRPTRMRPEQGSRSARTRRAIARSGRD